MRTDRVSAEADRLNDFWDRLVDGTAPASDSGHHPTAPEQQLETLVLYLESLKPLASPSHLDALRNTTGRILAKENPMNTRTSGRPAAPVTPGPPRRRGIGSRLTPVVRAFDGIAAVLLILIVVSALVLIGPARGLLDREAPRQFAAMFGLDENEPAEQGIGSHTAMTLEVRPGDYEGGHVEVGLWDVTLPGGSAMSGALMSGDFPGSTLGFFVSRGSVLFGSIETERLVEEGGSVGDLSGIDYVRNPDPGPAHLLVLTPMRPNSGFPLTIGAWAPGGTAASQAPSTPTMESDPVLIGSVELDDEASFQYRVLVSETVLAPGMGLGDVALFGPPSSVLRSITVREGQLAIVPGGPLATPVVTEELVPGDTVQLEAAGVWSSDLRVTGSENATVLSLLTMPAADNHTLNQSIESVAPFWGEWTVPESGDVDIAVRRLMLDVGGTYSLPADGGVLYHVVSGSAIVINRPNGMASPVAAGGTIAQIPGTILAFQNPGSDPVEFVQVMISSVHDDVLAAESPHLVGVEWLVRETETLTPGAVSLMLEVHDYNGENDGASGGQGPSLVLITSANGEISVRRDGGGAELVSGIGEHPVTPALGEGNRIGPGGYLLAEPGAGWFVTGASGAPSTAIVFTISPIPEPESTPIATPAPGSTATVTLFGEPGSCDIAPLTSNDVSETLATPTTAGSPLDRSMRDADGETADRLSTDAIVYRLQEYADCIATGDYSRIYAFYSDQAIRESDVIQDLVRSGHNVGPGPSAQVSFEELQLFPDGRAGARAVIDGEAAYLTFVYEDGRWKIDVWDDSDGGRVPLGTPVNEP